MEPDPISLSSHLYSKAKLCRRDGSRRGARRGLLTSTLPCKTTQQRNTEQQTTCPCISEDVVGATDTERTPVCSIPREDQEESGTGPQSQEAIIEKIPTECNGLSSALKS